MTTPHKSAETKADAPKTAPAARPPSAGDEPVPNPQTPSDKGRPPMVHPAPHMPGVKHVAGEEPPEPPDPDDKAPRAGFTWDEGAGKWHNKATGETTDDPPPAPGMPPPGYDNAQELYGLRKEGRLYSCQQLGLSPKLIEADSPEQAREAYCAELRREAGQEPHPKKAKKGKGAEKAEPAAPVALPAAPPGYAVVPVGAVVGAEAQKPAVKAELVKVVKLAP